MDFLAIAFYLSVLSYVLGTLLKALPVPFLSVKKLGRMLINDGLFSAVLVFLYNTILRAMEYIGSVLGVNWASFISWLNERINILIGLAAALRILGTYMEKAGFRFLVSSFISPLANLVVSCLMSLIFIFVFSIILLSSYKVLVAVGIALYAVPLRLTRSVGATIMAIAMVFTLGLPLMPVFTSTIYHSTVYQQVPISYREPMCSAEIRLTSSIGGQVGYAIIEGYDPATGDRLYRYLFDENGFLRVTRNDYGFPCRSHVIQVSVADNTYVATIDVAEEYLNKTLALPDIVALAPNRFILLPPEGVTVVSFNKINVSLYVVELIANTSSIIRIYVESSDGLHVLLNNAEVNSEEVTTVDWNGVSFKVYTYSIPPGTSTLNISLHYYKTTKPEVLVEPFIAYAMQVDTFSFEAVLAYMIYGFIELVVLPIVYLSILLAVSISVARLLGGYSGALGRLVGSYL